MPTDVHRTPTACGAATLGVVLRHLWVIGVCALTIVALSASQALASKQQLAMFEDDVQLHADPAGTLDTFRQLGVGIVRVYVNWGQIAPNASSTQRPPGFNAANPSAYPASNWAIYDEIVRDATARGIQVDLTLTAPAPLWANGPGAPHPNLFAEWEPSPKEYGLFVRAIGSRYSGRFKPQGATAPLPRVNFWALWNEPNFGKDLAPQATSGSRVSASPMLYRGLLDAGWSSLQASGHGRDTILIGSLAARGVNLKPTRNLPLGLPGTFGTTKPLQFIRALYCVDSRYRQLRGIAARSVACPTSAGASRGFRKAHPGLFVASGFADHPYPINLPPTEASSHDPDYTEFSELPRLGNILDKVQRVYGSSKRLPIYVTEYGYITNPPNHSNHYASPTTAAYFMNWAEYLSWRNPRIATTMQYLLDDPNPRVNVPEFGGFASGLEFFGGKHKPSYDAYRLALYLPVISAKRGRALEVWGCARPVRYASIDSRQPQSVQIQYQRGSTGPFVTVKTVAIANSRGYFDVRFTFRASGSVRLAYTYPTISGGATVFSRTQRITVT